MMSHFLTIVFTHISIPTNECNLLFFEATTLTPQQLDKLEEVRMSSSPLYLLF